MNDLPTLTVVGPLTFTLPDARATRPVPRWAIRTRTA